MRSAAAKGSRLEPARNFSPSCRKRHETRGVRLGLCFSGRFHSLPTWVEPGLLRQAPRQLRCHPRKIFRHRCKGRSASVGLRCLPSPVGLRRPPSPRYRSSGGNRTEPSSGGFHTMESAFSVSVSATKIWRFPPLDFCFLRDLSASSFAQCLGLFDGLDALPFVCRRGPPLVEISQPKFMR